MICILLCTVFPLVTTLATVLRLWQSGMFVSSSTPSPPPQHITGTEENMDGHGHSLVSHYPLQLQIVHRAGSLTTTRVSIRFRGPWPGARHVTRVTNSVQSFLAVTINRQKLLHSTSLLYPSSLHRCGWREICPGTVTGVGYWQLRPMEVQRSWRISVTRSWLGSVLKVD